MPATHQGNIKAYLQMRTPILMRSLFDLERSNQDSREALLDKVAAYVMVLEILAAWVDLLTWRCELLE